MFQAYMNLNRGTISPKNFFVSLFIWDSGKKENIKVCNEINKMFFNVKQPVLERYQILNRVKCQIGKYPNPEKDTSKLGFFYDAIMGYYDWTPHEFKMNKECADLEDYDFKDMISRRYAFDNKQRKLLGLEVTKIKREKMKKARAEKGLGDYF